MALPINLWLVGTNEEICEAFRSRFHGLPKVQVILGRFETLPPHDCFVTAANSFGIMNAGIDAAVIHVHGKELMEKIQLRILDEYLGEQPVGTAFIQETGNSNYPYICHAPTMRVPGSIKGTDKVYSATWAALVSVYRFKVQNPDKKIDSVVFPAMGAGFGGVPFQEVARQMAAAYRHYLDPPHRLNWDTVTQRQMAIAYDGGKQVVNG